MLAEVGIALTKGDVLQNTLQFCAEAIVRHLDAAFARIWTLNTEETLLELQASAGMYTHIDGAHDKIPVGKHKIGLIAQEKKPHLTNSVIGDPLIHDQEWARRESIVAFAGYPLIVEDRVTGVMAMFARKPLTESTLNALATVADSISLGITRKKAEEILIKEKNFSEGLINSLPGVLYLFDDKGKFLRWNKNLEKISEYSAEELKEMSPLDFFVEEDRKIVAEKIQEVFVTGKSSIEANLLTKSGKFLPYLLTGVRISINKASYLIGVGIDITKRKNMEEQILLAKHDWEDTFNTITDMITVHDKDYNIIRANKAAEKILGLPFLDATEAKCFRYYHGTTAPPEGCPSCQCLKTGQSATFEIFEPHLNSFIEIRAIPRFNRNNELEGLIHIVRDITKRKKNEEKLNQLLSDITKTKNEWETTFDTVSELIVLIDEDCNIVRCNRAFAAFAGVPVNEMLGRKYHEFFAPYDPAQFKYCKELIQKGETLTGVEMETDNGHWFHVSYSPIEHEKGESMHSVIIATDITTMKDTQKSLLESKEELDKRVQELEKFYEMAVGRELKMKELKKEIARLKAELSQHRKNGNEK